MIASERSLAAAHSQQHRQQSTTLGKARNGATKQPVRPVKIYVIDPRKLQQRLEAYVDQKQKRAEAEAEKEKQHGKNQSQEKNKSSTGVSPPGLANANKHVTTNPPTTNKLVTANPPTTNKLVTANPTTTTTKAPPTKLLPALVPVFPTAPIAPAIQPNHVAQDSTPLANALNGVTLQSLPCINGASLGLPALPLVVTNGVALIQPPPLNSQSSIPTSGLFLPGITAIPSVLTSSDGTLIASAQQQPLQLKPNPIYSSSKKRKVKKKKKAKKRKVATAKEKDDEEDRELAYLLKETTTRLGRISRPVSQPHSPSVTIPSLSATSSRATSPNSKLKKKIARQKDEPFRCETCVQVFINKEKMDAHFSDFPLHKRNNVALAESSKKEQLTSTNTNIQGTTHMTASSPSSPFSHLGTKEILITGRVSNQTMMEETPVTNSHSGSFNETVANGVIDTFEFVERTERVSNEENFGSLADSAHVSFKTSPPIVSHESLMANSTMFSRATFGGTSKHHGGAFAACLDIDTGATVSLVPSAEQHTGLFGRSMSPNIVQVPSSYSLPCSPPSRCLSPGLPDGIFASTSILTREGGTSPIATCDSPVDPMLLRSRSPFPVPPNPETSSHSVCASNLSIPEESLCKGELFMDLGDGCLENPASISAVSPIPFRNDDMAIYGDSNSIMKEPTQEAVPQDGIDSDHGEIEQRDSNSAAGPLSVNVTPMLLETTTEDANDGEIFQTARAFLHPSVLSCTNNMPTIENMSVTSEDRIVRAYPNCASELPRTPQSVYMESDVSMDSSEIVESNVVNNQSCRSIWHFVKDQIKSHGISQACGEISEMADKLSRIARDHFIPIREEEIERLGNSASIIHVDTPFFSHLLDLPFGLYIFKEDVGTRTRVPPPPPMTSSELSFTGGVEDVEKFLPPDIDLISLPHLTNLEFT